MSGVMSGVGAVDARSAAGGVEMGVVVPAGSVEDETV